MTNVQTLDREMYSEAYAAQLLHVSQSTLHYWLEGDTRPHRTYEPVIREAARGFRAPVTWAEFVEAGLLRSYRQDHKVPMKELRTFIDILRREFNVPYPLADRRPYVSGRDLVIDAQNRAELDPEFCLVGVVRNQPMLTPTCAEFFNRVSWEGDTAAAWRPHSEPDSPVRIRPDQRGGQPAVGGISTEVLWEHEDSGESVEEIAETFDLTPDQVRWAVSYENAIRAA